MNKLGLGLGLVFAGAVSAAPSFAEGLTFQPVAPQGLDAASVELVVVLQAGMPGQMAAFEQAGFGHYGALAVPTGVALTPELLSSVANAETPEAAQSAVLDACAQQTGAACTVIGLLMPGGN